MPPRPAAPVSTHQQPAAAAAAAARPPADLAEPLEWDLGELDVQEWAIEGLPGNLEKRSLHAAVENIGVGADNDLLAQWRQRDRLREIADHPHSKILTVSRKKADGPLGVALLQRRQLRSGRPWLYVAALGVRDLGGVMEKARKRIPLMEHAVCQALLDGLGRLAQRTGCCMRIATDYGEEAKTTASPRLCWLLGFVTDGLVLPDAQRRSMRKDWATGRPHSKLPAPASAPDGGGGMWLLRHDRLLPEFTNQPRGPGEQVYRWVDRWQRDAACLWSKRKETAEVPQTKAGIQAGMQGDKRQVAHRQFDGIAAVEARFFLSQAAYLWCVPDHRPAATDPAAASGDSARRKRHRLRTFEDLRDASGDSGSDSSQGGPTAAAAAPAAGQAPTAYSAPPAPPAPAPETPALDRKPQGVPATGPAVVAPASSHPGFPAASRGSRSPRLFSDMGDADRRLFDGLSHPESDRDAGESMFGRVEAAHEHLSGQATAGVSREELAAASGSPVARDFLADDPRCASASGDGAPPWRPPVRGPFPPGCPHPESAEFRREWLMGAFDYPNERGYTAEYWAEPEKDADDEEEEEEEDDDDEAHAGFGLPAEALRPPRPREQVAAELLSLPPITFQFVDRDEHVAVPLGLPWRQTPTSAL